MRYPARNTFNWIQRRHHHAGCVLSQWFVRTTREDNRNDHGEGVIDSKVNKLPASISCRRSKDLSLYLYPNVVRNDLYRNPAGSRMNPQRGFRVACMRRTKDVDSRFPNSTSCSACVTYTSCHSPGCMTAILHHRLRVPSRNYCYLLTAVDSCLWKKRI